MNILKLTLAITAAGSLSACIEGGMGGGGLTPYSGPNTYIAVANDRGRDSDSNMDDNAAIAVTPDGCQAWVIDDGVEGRASNRLDPVSGLPVCAGQPGVVYGPYQSGETGLRDYVPGSPLPVRMETVQVRPYNGQFRTANPAGQQHQ